MANEKMKVGLSFNGKNVEVELTQEQLKELGLIEEKKKTGYERVETGNVYYTCEFNGMIMSHVDNSPIDAIVYNHAYYYSDETIADNNRRADELMRKIRRFAAENGGIPSKEDWKDRSINKHYIRYDYKNGELRFDVMLTWRDAFQIYFKSKEACEKAIEEFKSELIWYFTEYQAQLY